MILQVPGYMYAYSKNRLYLTLYGNSRTTVSMDGIRVGIDQTSDYPFDGKVRMTLTPENARHSAFACVSRLGAQAGNLCPAAVPIPQYREIFRNDPGKRQDCGLRHGQWLCCRQTHVEKRGYRGIGTSYAGSPDLL